VLSWCGRPVGEPGLRLSVLPQVESRSFKAVIFLGKDPAETLSLFTSPLIGANLARGSGFLEGRVSDLHRPGCSEAFPCSAQVPVRALESIRERVRGPSLHGRDPEVRRSGHPEVRIGGCRAGMCGVSTTGPDGACPCQLGVDRPRPLLPDGGREAPVPASGAPEPAGIPWPGRGSRRRRMKRGLASSVWMAGCHLRAETPGILQFHGGPALLPRLQHLPQPVTVPQENRRQRVHLHL
jgi:hypothetical protein